MSALLKDEDKSQSDLNNHEYHDETNNHASVMASEPVDTDAFLSAKDIKHIDKHPDPAETNVIPDNYKHLRLCARLKVDLPYRRRFIHSFWLFWSFIGLGWIVGHMGPSFTDLRQIVNEDLESASWLFTICFMGYLLGSIIGGVLYDRFDKLLLIALSCFLMGLSTGFVPYCESFPLMLTMRFLAGLGAGGLDTGGNADMLSIWDAEGRPYILAVHACFGFGGIIAPLVTEPFLSKKFEEISKHNVTEANTTETTTVYGKTSIHYSYLISLFVIFSGGIPFLMMFVRNKCSNETRDMVAPKLNQKRPDKLSLWLKAFLCILLSLLMLLYCAVEDTFSGFLATFCVNYLKWDKGISSFATSLHWMGFSIGRFLGIFLITFFRPVQLLCSYQIFLILAFIAFTVCSFTLTKIGVWIFIPLAGFSMSVIWPCVFIWTEESILKVTGQISSMFLVASSFGLLINPLIVGYLMQNISPVAFVFVLLAECFLCFGTFLLIFLLVKKFIKNPPGSADTEIVVSP
ncbi:sodium-dependent glucose transporter 1-like isoform X4 [Dreissena polymorpha]|uniref:sodium-dependent glucose transporter 1-like isoform X4 n=1 Tax=Dreissena polymorpha TaxID=45954 RepID=UPI00226469B0|nr:sodium-dependent glucose transporter 1-like isoform X4 [Dreissena polymorpha]